MTLPAPAAPSTSWWRRLSTSMKAMLISIAVVIALVAVAIVIVVVNRPEPVALPEGAGAARTLSENAHYLDEVGADAPTLVEFLDFECEACGAFYPYMEQIREQYDGQINYVVRYFPLQGHFNSMNAAIAVEAAAQQDQFEGMYRMMFETQAEWGEGQTSEAERFRGYAETLGLDMTAYDQAVADPATQERVEEDFNAGRALNVSGTPTFFLDGEQLELTSPEDLPNALDAALNQ
ncbi:MAG: DsbA family protein [Brevibacterium aurantiacum]|uniref:Protein-disulfide isomerase n=1 Tax=Brevibacterium aurantiacum TaxID=273384 RepID=A0A3Q9NVW9_BREAU|nr:thioredoxin domain-containing protein [Brevibacterium aurantiacum]AZT94729.1 protein-disulfide isomerase [Brevibacterium aurantiacum]